MRTLDCSQGGIHPMGSFCTDLKALDALAPGGAFRLGAVHELLSPPRAGGAQSVALMLARGAQREGKIVAWSDPARTLYPPAVAAAGLDLPRLVLLRCANPVDELWALSQCLACSGVSATVAFIRGALSRTTARRLQLAAERGGGAGILMRPFLPGQDYAAATRWMVRPMAGNQAAQRWDVELLQGHGGSVGQHVCVEVDRETRAVRAFVSMAHRSPAAEAARITA